MKSARRGYCVIGSDIAGFGGPTIPANLYIRWAQFSTFCGLFLNGGHGERALWKRSEKELEIIREFAWLHTELVPYIYSHVVRCHEGNPPLMRPVADKYHYMFGDDFLVAPIYEDKLSRTVQLPAGRWRYFFDDADVINGPAQIQREFPLDEFPAFVRDGAIIPLDVCRDYTGFGDRDSADFLTVLVYPCGENEFTVYDTDGEGSTTIRTQLGDDLRITFAGDKKTHTLSVLLPRKPLKVERDGEQLAEGKSWRYDTNRQRLRIRTRNYDEGRYTITPGS